MRSNQFARVGAGWTPEFIEMTQVVLSRWSGSAWPWGRQSRSLVSL